MDNNILVCEYGLQQIEKITKIGLRIDFNQAMDSRLVTDEVAKLLARVSWLKYIRLGCDTPHQVIRRKGKAVINMYLYAITPNI